MSSEDEKPRPIEQLCVSLTNSESGPESPSRHYDRFGPVLFAGCWQWCHVQPDAPDWPVRHGFARISNDLPAIYTHEAILLSISP
jgi:hypothetical protein